MKHIDSSELSISSSDWKVYGSSREKWLNRRAYLGLVIGMLIFNLWPWLPSFSSEAHIVEIRISFFGMLLAFILIGVLIETRIRTWPDVVFAINDRELIYPSGSSSKWNGQYVVANMDEIIQADNRVSGGLGINFLLPCKAMDIKNIQPLIGELGQAPSDIWAVGFPIQTEKEVLSLLDWIKNQSASITVEIASRRQWLR